MKTYTVSLPQIDSKRRELYGAMLGLKGKTLADYSTKELEKICIKLGYLETVNKK